MKLDYRSLKYCAPLVAVSCIAAASANTDVWTTNASGSYSDSANWSGGVPGVSDDVFFNRGGGISYVVTFPGQSILQGTKNYVTGTAAIGPNVVTFAQSLSPIFGPSTFAVSSLVMGAPPTTPSILNSSLQTLSTATASVGLGSGSPGTLNVNAGTFQVSGSTADYELVVGNGGSGSTMNVSSGAQINLTGALGNAVIGKNAGVTGTANVHGSGATWTNQSNDASAPLAVGGFGSGFLNITSGGQVSDFDADVASEVGSTGTVTVDGAGSTWTNRSELIVGASGTGTLSVSNGGQVSNDILTVGGLGAGTLTISNGGIVNDGSSFDGGSPGSTGTVNVTGVGSKWTQTLNLRVGGGVTLNGTTASGALHVSAGGQVSTGGDADVAAAGTATVRVEDSGSQWTVGGVTNVGDTGSLTVVAGATVTTTAAAVAGTVLVDEVGATWNVNDYLSLSGATCLGIGCTATQGTVSVGDGARVNSRVTEVGTRFGAAQVFVDGADSTWSNAEQLYVGLGGGGIVMVTGGARVNSGTVEVGVATSAIGVATVDASTWSNSGDFTVGVAGTGKLTIASGGVVSVGGLLSVGPRGTVEGNSQITGNVHNAGAVAPGIAASPLPSNALGTLPIVGNYTQAAGGALDIELASTANFDKLTVFGGANLGGALSVSLVNGFTPAVGNSFDLLTATGGITGKFATAQLPSLLGNGHGPFWTIVYTSTDVILKLVNSPTGDYNHNGIVDAADYTLWRDTLGKTGIGLAADGDGNHVVDTGDYTVWKMHFGEAALGSGAGNAAGVAVVPEQATLLMLLAGILTSCCGLYFVRVPAFK
jgi:T5SS/PEP-CTERM-associated repeat protein